MYRFTIYYEDKGCVNYQNVIEACYIAPSGYLTVCGEILSAIVSLLEKHYGYELIMDHAL